MVTFDNAPVTETVLGVQFEPLKTFCNAHLGAFWVQLGKNWRKPIDAPLLPPQFEEFGEGKTWVEAGFRLKIIQDLNSRLQIRNVDDDRMIQIQNGRLYYNWLGHGGSDYPRYDYPRYDKVREEFDKVLNSFEKFVAEESLGDLHPNQWEVTYVNHVPRGTIWEDISDLPKVFNFLTASNYSASMRLESMGGEWHYEIEPRRGRLHIQLRHGQKTNGPPSELFILTLTARGPIQPDFTLDKGLDLGHETIVETFKKLTSEDALNFWGLINAID